MQLDELKKRIDNLTIGLDREKALEIFGFLTKPENFEQSFMKTRMSEALWVEFQKVKTLLDEDVKNTKGEGIRHASMRLFDCTITLDLKPSNEKAESKVTYPERWSNFEKEALIADNLFEKQKTDIDELRLKQLDNRNSSFHSFLLAVFNSSLLSFQKQIFQTHFQNSIFVSTIINKLSLNTDQQISLGKAFKQHEDENKKSIWFMRRLYEIAGEKNKETFNEQLPQLGHWFTIEATLNINADQQAKIDEFFQKNLKNNSYELDELITELISHSTILTPEQKEKLSMTYTKTSEKTDRSKRKRTPTAKANETLSKKKMPEEERSEKKQKGPIEIKTTEALSDADEERIIDQIQIALDEMWKKNDGKKFSSTHSPKFQTVDKKGYLIFKMLIKPDAQCKTNEEKLAFGKKVEVFLKNQFNLQQNTQTNNFKLIAGGFDSKWNKYSIKSNDFKRDIGLTLTEEEWNGNLGSIVVRGSTTATISEKLAKLKKSKKSAKKTSTAETSEIPENIHESSAQPSSPQDLSKETSKSREDSEDDEIKDEPLTPEPSATQQSTVPVIDLEGGDISASDKESQDLFKKWKEMKEKNQQKKESITKYRETFHKKSEELQTEKQRIRVERKRKLDELYAQEKTENTKLTKEEEKSKKDVEEIENKLAHYRSSHT